HPGIPAVPRGAYLRRTEAGIHQGVESQARAVRRVTCHPECQSVELTGIFFGGCCVSRLFRPFSSAIARTAVRRGTSPRTGAAPEAPSPEPPKAATPRRLGRVR